MKDLKIDSSMIEKSYSSKKVISDYEKATNEIGLWKSELILANKYFNSNSKILDIGCGTGRTTLGLYKLGYKNIEGLDLSEKMISKAKELCLDMNYKIKFHTGNVVDLKFINDSFDGALFSLNGIMQIPQISNRIQALKEVKRILKPGGYFIFTTHDRLSENGEFHDMWKHEEKIWSENKQDSRLHEFGDMIIDIGESESFLHFPTRDEIIDCIKKADFELVEDLLRSRLCDEHDNVKNYSSDCRFYIVKK